MQSQAAFDKQLIDSRKTSLEQSCFLLWNRHVKLIIAHTTLSSVVIANPITSLRL